jgi:hypothetical protein
MRFRPNCNERKLSLNEGSAADAGFSLSVFRAQRPGPADFVR